MAGRRRGMTRTSRCGRCQWYTVHVRCANNVQIDRRPDAMSFRLRHNGYAYLSLFSSIKAMSYESISDIDFRDFRDNTVTTGTVSLQDVCEL